ncbi:MAG: DUF3108 domain-containing protein [Akkermansiaceae bacterium]|nr:DUF3108 domain-containing protein [Akkermansiaceae bacterium]
MRQLLLLCSLLAAASAAHAQKPAWLAELAPPALGKHPRLTPTAVDFQVSWKGAIHSGAVTIVFDPPNANKPGQFVVKSDAQSQGIAAGLFPYEHHFWSELHRDTLRPRLFYAVETDAKEVTTTTNRYSSTRVGCTESNKNLETGALTTESPSFNSAWAHDIFSAMLFIRSQPLVAGDKLVLVVMPFKNPYLLRVQVVGREVHHQLNTIKLSVSMQKIDRTTLALKAYKKLNRSATLWLSDDADRIPVELRAEVFIGDVRATLTDRRKL